MDCLNQERGVMLYGLLTPDVYEYAAGEIYKVYKELFAGVPKHDGLFGMQIIDSKFNPEKHVDCLYLTHDVIRAGNTLLVCSVKETHFFTARSLLGVEKYALLVDFFENRLIRKLKINKLCKSAL